MIKNEYRQKFKSDFAVLDSKRSKSVSAFYIDFSLLFSSSKNHFCLIVFSMYPIDNFTGIVL